MFLLLISISLWFQWFLHPPSHFSLQHPPSPLSAVVADPGAAVPCARRRPCLAVLNDPDLLGTRFNPMKVRWQGFWQYGKKKHPEGLEELEHSPTWNLDQSDLHLLLSSLATRFWHILKFSANLRTVKKYSTCRSLRAFLWYSFTLHLL